MRRTSCLIIALSLLLASCTTPVEYVYVRNEPAQLPTLAEAVGGEAINEAHSALDLIMEPETIGDLLHNIQEYQRGYVTLSEYSAALEEYIDAIVLIHNDGGIKDGKNDI